MSILKAPNGKPSNLTPKQWRLVRTSEFKAWFGDWENDPQNASKVIDENGEPLVVWHGGEVRNIFDKSKIGKNDKGWFGYGFYFTEDKSFANSWGESKPYFIIIKNPFEIIKKGISLVNPFYNNSIVETDNKIKEGYDGSIFKLSKPNEYVVFYEFANNIKLADGTNTTFDPSNPDIRFDKGGETPNIHYSPILKNTEIVKDLKLTKNLLSLSHQGLSGGIKAVWDYPYENVSNVVIAYLNSKPIGVITDTNGVQNIFVKSEYRGFGIGKSLKNILNNIRFKKGGEIEILLAPNGKPSNLTPEQYKLVRTPAFKKWFGDWENDPANASKVVDENGEPLVVYRGFNSKSDAGNVFRFGINRFKENRNANRFGHYFTRSINVAKEYAEQGEKKDEKDVIVKSYFLKADNLADLTKRNPRYPTFNEWALSRESFTEYSPYALIERLKERTIPTHSYLFTSVLPKAKNEDDIDELSELKIKELEKKIEEDEKELKGIYDSSEVINLFHLIKMISGKELDEVIKEDYDLRDAQGKQDVYKWFINYKKSDTLVTEGLDLLLKELFIENNFNGGVFNEWQFGVKKPIDKEVFFVFEPNQIKLADGSNTTFDGKNPDIRFEEGGEVESITFYTRTYADGTTQRFSVEDYENNVLPTLPKDGKFDLGGEIEILLAPNGKPSNLTPEQYKLVRTPAFKKWFGDWENDPENASKVVDKNGEPMVVYRGYPKSMDSNIFTYDVQMIQQPLRRKNEFGFYFTNEKWEAQKYAEEWSKGEDYLVKSYFLNIKNLLHIKGSHYSDERELNQLKKILKQLHISPLWYKKNIIEKRYSNDDKSKIYQDWIKRTIRYDELQEGKNIGKYSDEDIKREIPKRIKYAIERYTDERSMNKVMPTWAFFIDEGEYPYSKQKEWKSMITSKGYDGIWYYNNAFHYDYTKEYVAFYPEQIKLADGTNTTFDPSNPDIRFELGGIYHGTNQKFDKFSTEYMGGGEGAQAFGWGLYFTSLEDIAKSYANTLGKLRVKGSTKGYDQETIEKATDYANLYVRLYDSLENGIREKEKEIASKHKGHHKYDSEQMILDVIKNLEWESNKYLYQVTLHKGKKPEEYIWLDWDKPLTKNIIEKIEYQADIENIYLPTTLLYNNLTDGNKLYITLTSRFDTEKETSLFLLRAGIDGIRYPAESISRGTTSRNTRGYNYVVFDDKDITIEDVKQLAKGGKIETLLAPNGKPSKLTPEQYKLVRTPAFKKWFGDWENDPENASKVVDINGEPLVVWHGGKQSIKIFKTPTHLGTLPSAMERVNDIAFWKPKFKSDYYECFIDIKKPYETIDVGIKKNWAVEMRIAKKEDCDGLKYKNLHENRGSTSYVVFEPNQIKLADGTNTTFDLNNPDIRYELGGETTNNYYSSILKNTEIKDMYKKGGKTKSDVRSEKPALLSNGLGVLAYEVDTKKVLLFKRQNSDTYDERDRGKWGVASRGIMSKNQLSTQVAQSLLLEKAGIFSDYIVPAYVYEYDRGFQITKFHNWVAFLPDEKKIDLSNSRYADAIWISLDELSYIIGSKGEGDKDTYTIDYKDIQWGVIELFENSDIVGLIEEYAKKYKESRVTIEEEVDPKLEKERIKLKYKELDFDLDPDETKKVLLAPNGKVSNLDEKQWKAVRSANFKKWFGDWEEAYRTGDYANVSKVIDENGEPLVVYRGHSVVEQDLFGYVFSYNVNRFKFNRQPNRFAFYFTKSKKIAELYSQLSPSGERYGGVGIVKPYFLNVRGLCDLTPNNPYYPTTEWWFEHIMVGKNLMVDLRFILQTKGEYDDYFYLTAYEIDTVINKYGDDSVDISRVPNILKERYRKDKNKNKVTWSGLKEYLKEILPKAKKRIDTIIKGYENSRYGHYINLNILLKCIFKTDNLSKLVDKGMLLDADMEKYLSRYTFAYFINQKSSPDGTDIVLKKMMIKKGYTGGVFLEHTYAEYLEKPNEDVYFVFDSNNIKLADGSNYTYKPDVMDTRYEDGGMFQIYPD